MATEPQPAEGLRAGGAQRSEQATTISRAMVKLLRQISGRGPTKARTTIGRDHVLVMFEDSLSEGERTLVEAGHRDDVAAVRRSYQDVMEAEASAMVAEVTGRKVARFMSANHSTPRMRRPRSSCSSPMGRVTNSPRRPSTSSSPQSASEPSRLGLWPVASKR